MSGFFDEIRRINVAYCESSGIPSDVYKTAVEDACVVQNTSDVCDRKTSLHEPDFLKNIKDGSSDE